MVLDPKAAACRRSLRAYIDFVSETQPEHEPYVPLFIPPWIEMHLSDLEKSLWSVPEVEETDE